MNFAKLSLDSSDGIYSYKGASNEEMSILGCFFTDDVGCRKQEWPSFKDWALADKDDPNSGFNDTIGSNATFLEEDGNGDIHLVDDTGSNDDEEYYIPGRIKLTRQQFVQLLDDWQEKVCKYKPKEVIIKYENDQFTIEINE
jgi:hypothetical protein